MRTPKEDFPITVAGVRRGLFGTGGFPSWRAAARAVAAKQPDFVSGGKRPIFRWRALPEAQYAVYGRNAATLRIGLAGESGERATGTKAFCEDVLRRAVRQWFALPRGREVETVAAAMPLEECPEKGPGLKI